MKISGVEIDYSTAVEALTDSIKNFEVYGSQDDAYSIDSGINSDLTLEIAQQNIDRGD